MALTSTATITAANISIAVLPFIQPTRMSQLLLTTLLFVSAATPLSGIELQLCYGRSCHAVEIPCSRSDCDRPKHFQRLRQVSHKLTAGRSCLLCDGDGAEVTRLEEHFNFWH